MLFLCFCIIAAAYKKIQQPVFIDFKPGVVHQASLHDHPIVVGLSLQNFVDVDVVNNTFTADLSVWFLVDPETADNLDLISKFSFNKGEIIDRSEPIKQRFDDRLMIRYDCKVKFSSNLNYKYFPLDTHRIFLTLNNKYIDSSQVQFVVPENNFVISPTIYIPSWHIFSSNVTVGYGSLHFDKHNDIKPFNYPRVVFEFDLLQTSMRNFIFIMLPMLIIFLLSLCAFGLNIRNYFDSMLNITSTGIAALLAYRYVIEKISPKVSYYLLCDHIFSLFLIILFFIFFIDIFYREKVDKYRGVLAICIYIIFLAGWLYLLFIW